MAKFLVLAPVTEPVDLTLAKLHCNVDFDDDDSLFRKYIMASREYGETATDRAFSPQTWDFKYGGFPTCGALELPLPPVVSVTSVKYLDFSGVEQTWDPAQYRTSLPVGPKAMPGRLQPAYGVPWPVTYPVMDAVTVRLVCGYSGSSLNRIPTLLVAAMLQLIERMNSKREAYVEPGEISSADALFLQFKVW